MRKEVKPIDNVQSSLGALYRLFRNYGIDPEDATDYAERFTAKARGLPINDICSRLQEKMMIKGLVKICIEINDCRDNKGVLDVLGVPLDKRGLYKEDNWVLQGFIKSLAESILDRVAA